MAYEFRINNDPYLAGYVVKEKIHCGKKNCHCYVKNELHTAYYLHYREYEPNPQLGKRTWYSVKKKKKYLKKADVKNVKRKIEIAKGYNVYGKLSYEILSHLLEKYKKKETLLPACYQTYLKVIWGHSKTTQNTGV
ncbi:MAG: hypothetical protein UT89_C0006G0014 [Parcubacteria group bacterium GW2011_GWE1_40_20]|nr:MAG: hypothetical protein UT89_C0006G0014 [Parcubacteria group bacterium GW2011_GWE1_40_20]